MYTIHTLKAGNDEIVNYIYIIVDTQSGTAAVVDPGWDLEPFLKKLSDIDARLTTILITHCHFDHIGLVNPLTEQFEVDVYIHQAEAEEAEFSCKNLNLMDDFDEIVLGETVIKLAWTPGHTNGSACFLLENDVFTGDTLYIEGVGMCLPEIGGCPSKLFRSTMRLKDLIKDNIRVWPGHSFVEPPGQTMEQVLKKNIYFRIDDEKAFSRFRKRYNDIIREKGLTSIPGGVMHYHEGMN